MIYTAMCLFIYETKYIYIYIYTITYAEDINEYNGTLTDIL